jgi:hypothetical protein
VSANFGRSQGWVAEKALAEADGKLSRKFMEKMEQAGVSRQSLHREKQLIIGLGGQAAQTNINTVATA